MLSISGNERLLMLQTAGIDRYNYRELINKLFF